MSVIRISPRVNMGQILARQINIDNDGDFNYIYSGVDPVANNPGLRYNEVTSKWQFSHDGTLFQDFGTGGGGGAVSGSASIYRIASGGPTDDNFHISNATTWNVDKSLIKTLIVETASADWDLHILQNDNGFSINDANIPAMQLMSSGDGDETIQRDFPYEDEDTTKEVHFFFVDNSGTALVTVTVIGYGLN